MNRQLIFRYVLFYTGFSNKSLSQYRRLSGGNHPANNIAAEDVHNHIQVKICPFYRAKEFGNIPGPYLVRPCSQKLRLLIYGMTQLVPALLNFLVVVEDAVHGTDRAMVLSFVQKGCIDFLGGLIHEPLCMKDIEYFLSF